jgi:hypothetical protein
VHYTFLKQRSGRCGHNDSQPRGCHDLRSCAPPSGSARPGCESVANSAPWTIWHSSLHMQLHLSAVLSTWSRGDPPRAPVARATQSRWPRDGP